MSRGKTINFTKTQKKRNTKMDEETMLGSTGICGEKKKLKFRAEIGKMAGDFTYLVGRW